MTYSQLTHDLLEEWSRAVLAHVEFETLSDGEDFARIPSCQGAVATGPTRDMAERTLYQVLQDWVRVGIQVGAEIPVIDGVDLSRQVSGITETHV